MTNLGYRLLRCTARVEPAGTPWIRLHSEYDGRPFSTIDQTDISIELNLPEAINRPLISEIVIESNGGTKRIAVRVERPTEPVMVPESAVGAFAPVIPELGQHLSRMITGLRPAARIAVGSVGAMALRAIVMLITALTAGGRGAWHVEARLSSVAILMVGAGAAVGARLAARRGEWRGSAGGGVRGSRDRSAGRCRWLRCHPEH